MRLDAFRGLWTLTRTIDDIRGGRAGRFEGTARFDPARLGSGDGLAYFEEGRLAFAGGPAFAASQRYLWCEAGADSIEVRFADGRFFHRFYADEARPVAYHDCPPDQYRVAYDFRRWPRWRAEWRVVGPAKNYGLVSDYRPTGQQGDNSA